MTKPHTQVRRLAVGGAAAALSVATLAVTSPASADSASLNYTCERPLGSSNLTASFAAPATVPVGGSAAVTTTVVVPEDLAGLLASVGVATVEGSAVGKATVNGLPLDVPQVIPVTSVPAAGSMTVKASGKLAVPATLPVGTELAVTAGDFTVDLDGKTADGQPSLLSPYAISCVQDPEQNNEVGTVTVVKAGSKSKVSAKGAKKKATITVKVKSTTTVAATGKVKVSLKGPKKVTKTAKIKNGVAKVTVKKLKKGKYKIATKYAGDKNVTGSNGKGSVKVK